MELLELLGLRICGIPCKMDFSKRLTRKEQLEKGV